MRCKVTGLFWFSLLVILRVCSPVAAASAALTIDPQEQLDFADHLFSAGQYRRAAEEYQRFAFFFPDDPRRRSAVFKTGQAFLHAQDAEAALVHFKALTDQGAEDAIALEAQFMTVECYVQMNAITQAVVHLHNIIALNDDPNVKDRAYYRLGWLHIEQTDWNSAQRAFESISTAQHSRYRIADLNTALQQTTTLPQKNPTLAGTLSIIPGAGQLYCQRYEDALAAFVVNVGLTWAAVEAFDKEQYALGGLLTFVGIGFYSGNIYSAVSSAHKYNQEQKRRYIDNLKQNLHIGIGPPPQAAADGIMLRLNFQF